MMGLIFHLVKLLPSKKILAFESEEIESIKAEKVRLYIRVRIISLLVVFT